MKLENYFKYFRENTIGQDTHFMSPYGRKKIIYSDWTATGRLYKSIEESITYQLGPYIGNTHSYSSETGSQMTEAYSMSNTIIKKHVNASSEDVLIFAGTGMTGAMNKFQRILGLKDSRNIKTQKREDKPIVFITHMEHHSNHTSWLETKADVIIVPPNKNGSVSPKKLNDLLQKYKDRKVKIGAFTACSNVTGIITPYYELAKVMHENGGVCVVDFAASAPYVDINMHPKDPLKKLDAICFSMHKFLGGPMTPGVLIFDSKFYNNDIPDHPGGGTVAWTNPWGDRVYYQDIEMREDGGTPGILQAIKAALCVKLKEKMGTKNILARDKEMNEIFYTNLKDKKNIVLLEERKIVSRLSIFALCIKGFNHNLVVKVLNDRYGIQARGGCSCAGTYAHVLFKIGKKESSEIVNSVKNGDLSTKSGWVRISLHPIMTDKEVVYITNAIKETAENIHIWEKDYKYVKERNDYVNKYFKSSNQNVKELFKI